MRPLHFAARYGFVAIGEHLVAHGAETRVELPGGGMPPIAVAKAQGRDTFAAFLRRDRIAAKTAGRRAPGRSPCRSQEGRA